MNEQKNEGPVSAIVSLFIPRYPFIYPTFEAGWKQPVRLALVVVQQERLNIIHENTHNNGKYMHTQSSPEQYTNPTFICRVARQTCHSTPPWRPSSLPPQRVLLLRSHLATQRSSSPCVSYATRPARGDVHKTRDFHFQPQLHKIRVSWSPATRVQVGMA